MPTTRPRHTLTETDDLAAALDVAARRWPEDATSRSRRLLRLVDTGRQAIDDEGSPVARDDGPPWSEPTRAPAPIRG